jgi:hypothetical protein
LKNKNKAMLFDTYLDFFENLAIQCKAIGHNAASDVKGFHWIMVSSDPFPNFYLDHLTDAQRNSLPNDKPFMVLENYLASPDILNDGDESTEFMGAFMILKQATQGDVEEEKEVLAHTEMVARQIIARMKRDLRNQCDVDLANKFKYEHIGPALGGKYFGTKVHFVMEDSEPGLYNVVDNDWNDLD